MAGEASLTPSYDTLESARRFSSRVKGSRFEAMAWPVGDDTQARSRLSEMGKDHPAATHLCWALRLRDGRSDVERTHDAGEPAGTAGLPILQAIRGAGLANVLVAVARYFGGTKLGKGGLARAYRQAARGALEGAPTVTAIERVRLRVTGPIERDGEVRHLVAGRGGHVAQSVYLEDGQVALLVVLPRDDEVDFRDRLNEITRGAFQVEIQDRP